MRLFSFLLLLLCTEVYCLRTRGRHTGTVTTSDDPDALASLMKNAAFSSVLQAVGETWPQNPDSAGVVTDQDNPDQEMDIVVQEGNGQQGNKKRKLDQVNLMENGVKLTTSVYPPVTALAIAAGVGVQTLTAARAAIRGGTSDAAGLGGQFGIYTFQPGSGRVTGARFYVRKGAKSNPGDMAVQYCDVLWNHAAANGAWYREGNVNARIRAEYQTGHIVGAALGGSNSDPANFIPMHFMSNTNNGRWSKAEQIALAVKLRAGVQPQSTRVEITFVYADAPGLLVVPPALLGNNYIPIGGEYRISVTTAKWNARFNGAVGLSTGATVFQTHAVAGGGRYTLTIPWRNTYDAAVAAVPVGGLSPKYINQANLF